jgi:putative FmdB family regulatory protein
MPIYEYQCQKCGQFEVTQRITEKPLGKCPTCKGKVKKLISNTSFQLKGTGWYVTDYARKGQQNGDAKSSSDSKSEAKTESKNETKSETKSESKKSESTSSSSSSGKPSSTPTPASTT